MDIKEYLADRTVKVVDAIGVSCDYKMGPEVVKIVYDALEAAWRRGMVEKNEEIIAKLQQ